MSNLLSFKDFSLIAESVEVINDLDTLNIPREQLPQIKHTEIDDFVEFLRSEGVEVFEDDLDVSDVNLTQSAVQFKKISDIVSSIANNPNSFRRVLVSKDHRILDGHHRLMSWKVRWPDNKVPVYIADTTIQHLIQLGNSWCNDSILEESAPPDSEIEKWIKDNKERFKKQYGDRYKEVLYAKAWKMYKNKDS